MSDEAKPRIRRTLTALVAVMLLLLVAATVATAHMIENHLYEHPQSPAAMECVTGAPAGVAPVGARNDGRAPHRYSRWEFTNLCNQIITVVTCLEGASCNELVKEYGREAIGEFQYYWEVSVVEPGETTWITLCWKGYGDDCYYQPPSAVRYAACFGDVTTEENYLLGIVRDGLIVSLPNGDFACMLHGVETAPPPPVQGGGRAG